MSLLPAFGVSTCRFGTHHHARPLIEATQRHGIHLFATATSYDDGFGEALLGELSTQLGATPTVLVSLGFIEGMLYHRALEREHRGEPYPELVRWREGAWHCIHPHFLREQLTETYHRLRQASPIAVLLQHPEVFLQWATTQGIPQEEALHELLRRLEQAFAFLEQECQQGRLFAYGIQSEQLLPTDTSIPSIPIAEVLELARSICGDEHHCRLLAVPFNLFESAIATEAVVEKQTLLEYASQQHLHVIVYRPLTARLNGRPVLIAEPTTASGSLVSVEHIRGQLREFVHTEVQLLRALMELPLDGVQRDMVRELLTLSLLLQEHWHEFASYEDWLHMKTGYLAERFRSVSAGVEPLLTETTRQPWEAYKERFHQALSDITRLYAARAWERARRLRTVIEDALHHSIPPVPLAQLALALLHHTEGVGTIIVSSSSADHIAELATVNSLSLPPLKRQQWLDLRSARIVLEHGF